MNVTIPEKINENFLTKIKFLAVSRGIIIKEFFLDQDSEDYIILFASIPDKNYEAPYRSLLFRNWMENKSNYEISNLISNFSGENLRLLIHIKDDKIIKIVKMDQESGTIETHIYNNNRRIFST